ncbi:transposase [Facklamia sp. P12937]|uniref:transposase n=1 Tax=Facklamia sp. P12937 TaxID=3421949 RepID=UPI003D17942F
MLVLEVLKNVYRAVQDLRFSLDQSDPLMFMTTLYQPSNQSLAPRLKRVLRIVTKFKQYIKNSFHYHTLTNGPIEGINNKIKVLKRHAYGYKNNSHFKNRIPLISRLYVSGRKEKETKQPLIA